PCTATSYVFLFHDTSTTQIYTLSLHDALPIFRRGRAARACVPISESVQGGSLPALRCLRVGRGIRSLHHVAPVRDERGVRSNPVLRVRRRDRRGDEGVRRPLDPAGRPPPPGAGRCRVGGRTQRLRP